MNGEDLRWANLYDRGILVAAREGLGASSAYGAQRGQRIMQQVQQLALQRCKAGADVVAQHPFYYFCPPARR